MNISYARAGDYLLPEIRLNEPPLECIKPFGRYGLLRQKYLKEHRTVYYNTLLLSERLFPHLREMDETASERRRRKKKAELQTAAVVESTADEKKKSA